MTPPPTLDDLIRLVQQDTATDDRLEQLRTAALTVRQLTETGDAVLGHYVDQARAGGHTWTEISSVLGVTKQAVHKRFTAGPDFARFTQRAIAAIAASEDAARALQHTYVGTEHLLLGLIAESVGGVAADVLSQRGIAASAIEQAVQRRVGRGQGGPADAPRPLTPRARRLLNDIAPEAALELGHSYVGTEHLLLALSRSEGVARDVLAELGMGPDVARAAVIEVLSGYKQP